MSYINEALQLILDNQIKEVKRDTYIQESVNRIERKISELKQEIKCKERKVKMTSEQKCIIELWKFIDDLTDKAVKKDTKVIDMFRGGRISGADAYQGAPPISRIRDNLLEKHEQVIYDYFKAKEVEEYENQTAHREC